MEINGDYLLINGIVRHLINNFILTKLGGRTHHQWFRHASDLHKNSIITCQLNASIVAIANIKSILNSNDKIKTNVKLWLKEDFSDAVQILAPLVDGNESASLLYPCLASAAIIISLRNGSFVPKTIDKCRAKHKNDFQSSQTW